jgi:catechol 2,3-dioxygenase-like lactoylglutathione lyase family enzyme
MNNEEQLKSRRTLLQRLGTVALIPLLPGWSRAQNPDPPPSSVTPVSQLPLKTTGIEHISAVVPDVAAAGAFYGRVFNPLLSKEKDSPLRYYVPFGIGYLALGSHGADAPVIFDHFCALVTDYDPAAMAAQLKAEGLPAGRYGIIPDPDKVGFQLLRAPGGPAPTWVPAGRIVEGDSLVQPIALNYIVHFVADLDKTLEFYRRFLGPETAHTRSPDGAWFQIAKTRLFLESATTGEPGRIARVGVNVQPFNRKTVKRELKKLGATVEDISGKGLRFTDANGLTFELLETRP